MDNQNINVISGEDARPTATLWLIWGFALWLIDVFVTYFLGVSLKWFTDQSMLEIAIRSFLNVFTFAFLLIYVLRQRGADRTSVLNVATYIGLQFVIHIIIQFGGLNLGGILHMLTALAAYFMLLKPAYEDTPYVANGMLLAILFVDFFFLTILLKGFGIKTFIVPIWFIGLWVITANAEQQGILRHSGVATALKVLVTLIFILAYGSTTYKIMNYSEQLDMTAGLQVKQTFISAWNTLRGIPEGIQKVINDTKKVYQEDYYTGEIDSNAKKQLGVFIEDLEKSQPDYYADEPVSIWATLVVSTLKDTITVRTRCLADKSQKENKITADEISPKEFKAQQYDEVPVDCTFKEYSFREGTHSVTINTTFDFETQAYQKKYFINKERFYAFRRQDIDPLDNYGITDKEPEAVFTSGPVMIGMDTRSSLINVDTEADDKEKIMLGITLRDRWEGDIVRVDKLTLYIPQSMHLEGKCSGLVLRDAGTVSDGKAYELEKPLGKIKDYRTIRCPLVIDDPQRLLGEAPLAIRYFKVDAKYTYTLEKSTTITVKNSDDIKKLKEKTGANPPSLEIQNMKLSKEEKKKIDLYEHSSDAETTEKSLYLYKVESIENKDVVNCFIYQRHTLICEAKTKPGTSRIKVSVNDLAKTSTEEFYVCVDTECPKESGANNKREKDQKEEGPVLITSFPKMTIDLSSGKSAQVYLPTYIKDGDGRTPVADMDFPDPHDPEFKRSITRSGTQIWMMLEYTGSSCISDYEFSFQARDKDSNTGSFSWKIDVVGCDG